MSGCVLVVSFDEQCDKIFLTCLLFSLCFLHRLNEGSVGLVVSECLDNVGHAHFKDNIHTALEVKAQSDLCLETLLIRVDSEILHRVLVVLLRYRIFQLSGLAVIIFCGKRERQIKDACKRHEDGHYNYNSFVLHVDLLLF